MSAARGLAKRKRKREDRERGNRERGNRKRTAKCSRALLLEAQAAAEEGAALRCEAFAREEVVWVRSALFVVCARNEWCEEEHDRRPHRFLKKVLELQLRHAEKTQRRAQSALDCAAKRDWWRPDSYTELTSAVHEMCEARKPARHSVERIDEAAEEEKEGLREIASAVVACGSSQELSEEVVDACVKAVASACAQVDRVLGCARDGGSVALEFSGSERVCAEDTLAMVCFREMEDARALLRFALAQAGRKEGASPELSEPRECEKRWRAPPLAEELEEAEQVATEALAELK